MNWHLLYGLVVGFRFHQWGHGSSLVLKGLIASIAPHLAACLSGVWRTSGAEGRCDCSRCGLTCRPTVNYSTPAAAEQFRGDESPRYLAGGVNFISPPTSGCLVFSPWRAETLFLLSLSASFLPRVSHWQFYYKEKWTGDINRAVLPRCLQKTTCE